MKKRHSILIFLAMAAVVLLLLYWVFRSVDLDGVAKAFRSAQWGWLPLAVLAGLLVYPVKAVRWRIILAPVQRLPMRPLLSSIMIGFMANCIFSRLGEIVRGLVLSLKTPVRTSVALSSIALERVFDICIVLLFLVLALLWLHPEASGEGAQDLATVRLAGLMLAALFLVMVGFLVFLRLKPELARRVVIKCSGWLPQRIQKHVSGFLESFLTGLNSIKDARQIAALLGLSVIHWTLQVFYFLFVGWCFPELNMTFPQAMLIFAITALGVGAVATPGYLGIFQGGVKAAAAIVAMAPYDSVVSYSLLSWAANIPVVILVGFICLWIEGLTLGQLRVQASQSGDGPQPNGTNH